MSDGPHKTDERPLAEDLKELMELLGAEQVSVNREDLEAAAWDITENEPSPPRAVVKPRTTEHVQATVRWAEERGVPLTPRVANLNVGGLSIPSADGVVVDFTRMNRILSVNREDMYTLIEPGVTWGQLRDYLEENDVPLVMGYPLSPPESSILAGMILDGLGTLSLRFGAYGQWINGLEVILADGRAVKIGACSISNSWFSRSPFPDLAGLFIGWQGTTGLVTKMAVQLHPKPKLRKRMAVMVPEARGGSGS